MNIINPVTLPLIEKERFFSIFRRLIPRQYGIVTDIEPLLVNGFETVVRFYFAYSEANMLGCERCTSTTIAVHNTKLGPAVGGMRISPLYKSVDASSIDACDLAAGMTLKNAGAGLPIGGGKWVFSPTQEQGPKDVWTTPVAKILAEILYVFNTEFRLKKGLPLYHTAEDAGNSKTFLDMVRKELLAIDPAAQNWVLGKVDPSEATASGTFACVFPILQHHLTDIHSMRELTVSISGAAGNVGHRLAKKFLDCGTSVYLADMNHNAEKQEALQALQIYGMKKGAVVSILSSKNSHKVPCDIWMPCAMSHVLNQTVISELGARVVLGCANVQLTDSNNDLSAMREKGVLWVPDTLNNAGGVIYIVGTEVFPNDFSIPKTPHTVGVKIAAQLEQCFEAMKNGGTPLDLYTPYLKEAEQRLAA